MRPHLFQPGPTAPGWRYPEKVEVEFGLGPLPGQWRIDQQAFASCVAAREQREAEDKREESGLALEVQAAAAGWLGLHQG